MTMDSVYFQNLKNASEDARTLERLVNDDVPALIQTRTGGVKPNYAKFLADRQDELQLFFQSSGYQIIGSYAAGLRIATRNQVFWKDGGQFRAAATLVLPYTTSGDWSLESEDFVAVGDIALCQQLADSGTSQSGMTLVGGACRVVGTIEELRQQTGAESPYVMAAGYYARGDKSPNLYCFDNDDQTSIDNGGTVIVTVSGCRYKLSYSGSVSIDDFGARLAADVDCSARIQVAIDWSSASGVPLRAGAWTYGLDLSQRIDLEAGAGTYCALIYKTGVKIRGEGMGATVFRLRDNQSTDANPVFFNLIAANTVLDQIDLYGITFDVNGENNKISPERAQGVYNAFNCAAFMVSGSVATTGSDARVNNSRISYCEVLNIPGVTGIALGQRFGHSGVKGNNVEISNCRFYNNGIDSSDHSSIYGFGDGSKIFNNVFDFPVPSTGREGPVACVECFGSNVRVYDNYCRNYLQFAWVGAGEEGEHRNISIHGNVARTSFRFIDTWGIAPQDDGVANLLITKNMHILTGDPLGVRDRDDRVAISLVMSQASLRSVTVTGNVLICEDRSDNTGIVIYAEPGNSIGSIFLSENVVHGYSRGIGVAGRVYALSMSNNVFENMLPSTNRPADTVCIDVSTEVVYELSIAGNIGLSSDVYVGGLPSHGITLTGTIGQLHMEGNGFRASSSEIVFNAIVGGRRTGRQALIFGALPSDSTWRIGDTAYLFPAPMLGASPNRYILDGWQRMTDGTSNVLGFDWQERRMPTGG